MHLICFNYLQLSEESCNYSLVCNCSPLTHYSAIVYSSTNCAIALSPRHLQCYFAIAQLHLYCLCWKTLQYLKYIAITNQYNISSVVKLESNHKTRQRNHQLWCASYTTESDWNVLVLRNVKCLINSWQIIEIFDILTEQLKSFILTWVRFKCPCVEKCEMFDKQLTNYRNVWHFSRTTQKLHTHPSQIEMSLWREMWKYVW